MAATANQRNSFRVSRYSDFGATTHKLALATADPSAAENISEVTQPTGSGYTDGGYVIPFSTPAWDAVNSRAEVNASDDVVFTGPLIGSPQWFVLYRVSDGAIVADFDEGAVFPLATDQDSKTFLASTVDGLIRNS